jgi:hypothetical protein
MTTTIRSLIETGILHNPLVKTAEWLTEIPVQVGKPSTPEIQETSYANNTRFKTEFKATNPKDIVGTLKAPMSTVSAVVMAEVGVAMLEGAAKYGRHNYRSAGVSASVYYDATMRHLMSWWEGEDTDEESGLSHVTKAITSLFVLRDAMIHKKFYDDRPPSSAAFYAELNAKAAAIIKRYEDRKPKHYTIADPV